jgi:hypothetical protein
MIRYNIILIYGSSRVFGVQVSFNPTIEQRTEIRRTTYADRVEVEEIIV